MVGPLTSGGRSGVVSGIRWLWRRSLWVHAVALGLVLAAAVVATGFHGVFSSDEGAGILQAQAVHHGWSIDHPFPVADPEGRWYPLEKSGRTHGGGFAPLPKKPLYSTLNALADRLLGAQGMALLSAIGALSAAVVAAGLARLVDPGLGKPTLWLTGLATPLLADGLIVIGHTLGAALAGALVWSALTAMKRLSVPALACVAVSAGIGAMVRNESILFAAAVVLVLLVRGLHRDRRASLVVSAAVSLGLVAGVALDRRWTDGLFGSGGLSGSPGLVEAVPSLSASRTGVLDDRWTAFVTSWLRPGYEVRSPAQIVGLALVVVGGVLVYAARRTPVDRSFVRFLTVAMGVLAFGRIVLPGATPDVVPGLLIACPFVVWGVLALCRSSMQEPVVQVLLAVFGVFAAAVLSTQYREAGSWEWGGRYFAVGLPVLAPVLAVGGRDLLRRLDVVTGRAVLAALVAVGLALGVTGVRAVRDSRMLSGDLVDSVMAVADESPPGDGGLPVIISTEAELPRTAWDRIHDARWFYADPASMGQLLQRLDRVGITEIVLATRHAEALAITVRRSSYALPAASSVPLGEGWWFVPLGRR